MPCCRGALSQHGTGREGKGCNGGTRVESGEGLVKSRLSCALAHEKITLLRADTTDNHNQQHWMIFTQTAKSSCWVYATDLFLERSGMLNFEGLQTGEYPFDTKGRSRTFRARKRHPSIICGAVLSDASDLWFL